MNLQQEALALNMDLSEKEPAAFADLLGNNYYNIGNLEIFNLNFAKAREYFHLADSTYSLLPQNERIENLKQQFKNRSDFTESEEAVFTVLVEKANIFSLIPEPDSVKFHYQLAELEFEKLSKIDGGQNITFTIIVMYRGLVELSKQIEEKYRYQKKYIL